MSDPVRVAFCPIMFSVNGGQFDDLGRPYVPTDQEFVRGKCSTGFDCGQCRYLTIWVEAKIAEGWSVGWECVQCMKRDVPIGKYADKSVRYAPGFYQSSSHRQWDDEVVDPGSPLKGCTQCGYGSSLLQLVLRR